MSPTPTEIRVRHPKKLRLALMTAAVLGGFYLFFGYLPVWAWIGGIVVAIALVYRAIKGESHDPVITLNEEGIFDRRLRVGVIRWDDIRRAVPFSLQGVDYLSLELHDMKTYEARRPLWLRLLSKGQRLVGLSSVSILANGLDMDLHTLADEIQERCGVVSGRGVGIE
ncbi:MAG TPA: STM3941 family protein [Pyrinomonadaceae bacterium]|nr:STM3941 family protein [Pyrinomonadaceae bacterium]